MASFFSLPWGFPGGSGGKESACSAGDLGSIPGLGRFPGGGNGNPLQYSCLEIPWTEEPGRLQSIGQRVGHDWATNTWAVLETSWRRGPGARPRGTEAQTIKNQPAMQETWVWPLGREDPLEGEMATHSSILAWRIPWTKKPSRLQSMGLQRVRHGWVTNTFALSF